MNFSTNWRDRRAIFGPTHYSFANYSTETKNEMKNSFGEELFLNNLHLIPDPLKKNLADTIITEEKMAPKSKLQPNIDVKTKEDMHIPPDNSALSGITSFFSGVLNIISNAMFSKPKQESDTASEPQMALPSMWRGAKLSDENKILQDENRSDIMSGEISVTEMTDCRAAVAHCQNKIEQVRLLLSSKPVPCNVRVRRRPKKVFVEAGSVEDSFEDAFAPEDFENLADDDHIEYSSPVCHHDDVLLEVQSPKVKIDTATLPRTVPETITPEILETTEIVQHIPELETADETKVNIDNKELVVSCEDKITKLKALLQERRKKPKVSVEPEPDIPPEMTINEPAVKPEIRTKEPVKTEEKELLQVKMVSKVKDKRFKNPNRCSDKRRKSKKRKSIQEDVLFANEINPDELSSVENSPSLNNTLENYLPTMPVPEKEYFDEVSGRFHSTSVESDDSFQIVFNDSPKSRLLSDCESEDSFIVFEDSPDSCYTSNDVFGDSESDYDSDSDYSDSGCGNNPFKLSSTLSKSVSNLADDSLYVVDSGEDEVDCAKVEDLSVCESVVEDTSTGLLLDERKKLLRRNQPAKTVRFSEKPPKVHVMRVWAFAARKARAGHWERFSLDRDRFKRRIADVDMAVSWVLKPQHRSRVMFQRFMPWWNAQRRKEIAEKKEREAEEQRKREEEAQKAEEAKVNGVEVESTEDLKTDEANKAAETPNEKSSEEMKKIACENLKKYISNEKLKKKSKRCNNKDITKKEIVPYNGKIVEYNSEFTTQNILKT